MKKLETISELDILRHAYFHIEGRYEKVSSRLAENPDEEMPLLRHLAAEFSAQMEEIRERISELEIEKISINKLTQIYIEEESNEK